MPGEGGDLGNISSSSPWRGFYRRFGEVFVLAAVGPKAEVDPRGFKRAVVTAEERLEEVEGL